MPFTVSDHPNLTDVRLEISVGCGRLDSPAHDTLVEAAGPRSGWMGAIGAKRTLRNCGEPQPKMGSSVLYSRALPDPPSTSCGRIARNRGCSASIASIPTRRSTRRRSGRLLSKIGHARATVPRAWPGGVAPTVGHQLPRAGPPAGGNEGEVMQGEALRDDRAD